MGRQMLWRGGWCALLVISSLLAPAAAIVVPCCDIGAIRTAVASNAIVTLDAGRYTGDCSAPISLPSTPVMLAGLSMNDTVIDCAGTGRALIAVSAVMSSETPHVIANLTFTRGVSSAGGAAVFMNNTNAVFQSVRFLSNSAAGSAILLHAYALAAATFARRLTLQGCLFTANTAAQSSAVESYADYVVIDACDFTANSATSGSGTVNIANPASLVSVTGTTFTDNTHSKYGALLVTPSSAAPNVTLRGVAFTTNKAYDEGAGLSVTRAGAVLVESCTFWANTANLGGSYNGGGARIYNANNVTVSNSTFSWNTAGAGGGLATNNLNALLIVNCAFNQNSVANRGGGLGMASMAGSTSIINSRFVGNSGGYGAGLTTGSSPSGKAVNITGCTFSQNSASTSAGAVEALTESYIVDTVFSENSAIGLQTAAAVSFNNGRDNYIQGCTFVRNVGGYAPAIYMASYSKITVRGTTFASNIGLHAAYMLSFATARFYSCTFFNHTCDSCDGAALYMGSNSQMYLTDCTLRSNYAGTNGGGVVLKDATSSLYISGGAFIGNSAAGLGAALYASAGTLSLSQSTLFVRNNVSRNPAIDTYTTPVGSCYRFWSDIILPPGYGCAGTYNYACVVQCLPNQRSSTSDQTIMCSSSTQPNFSTNQCMSVDVLRSSWIGGNATFTPPSFGVQNVASPANRIGQRSGATLFETPLVPGVAVVFGGNGYNEAFAQDSTSALPGGLLADSWLINTTQLTPVMTWIAGPKDNATPVMSNTGTGTPGGRVYAAGWVDQTAAYLFGGYGHSTLQTYVNLNCLWRMSLLNPQAGWTFASGSTVGNEASVGTLGTFSAASHPSGRFGHAAWTMSGAPRIGFVYGGQDSTGYLGDLWAYDASVARWGLIGGSLTANVTPNWGTLNVSSLTNTPGARYGHSVWATSAGVFLFGGQLIDGVYNDLWRGALQTTPSLTIVWTYIAGSTSVNAAGNYASSVSSYCMGCAPAARAFTALMSSPELAATTGLEETLLVYGGVNPNLPAVDGAGTYSDVWEVPVTPASSGAAMWIAGQKPANVPISFTALNAPLASFHPGSRSAAITWPDRLRPGAFYVLGGAGAYNSTSTRPGNDLWRMSLVRLVLPVTSVSAQAGVPFTVAGRLVKNGVTSPTLNDPHATVSAAVASVIMQSAGFVNGDLTLVVSGPFSGTPVTHVINVTLNGDSASFSVTLSCDAACSACTGTGRGASVCTCSSPAYVRSPVTGLCQTTCETGFYKGATDCLACDPACASCTGAGTGAGVCACNETANYALNAGSTACIACPVAAGSYLALPSPAHCATCTAVSQCASGVTCKSAVDSQCAVCAGGYYRQHTSATTADTCAQCTACQSGVSWSRIPCGGSNDAVCEPCTNCGLVPGTYPATVCNSTHNAVCMPCAEVQNCAQTPTCGGTGSSSCPRCEGGFFLDSRFPAASDVCRECSNCPDGTFQLTPCSLFSNVTCATCSVGCALCSLTGLSTSVCKRCDESLGWALSADGSQCVPSCPAGTFRAPGNDTSPARCVACLRGCTACTYASLMLAGAGGGCMGCDAAAGFMISADRSTCVDNCRSGQFVNETVPRSCSVCLGNACPAGTYIDCTSAQDAECVACTTPGCATCSGPGLNLNDYCQSCDESAGYAVNKDGICTSCDVRCSLCSGAPDMCTQCAPGYTDPPACRPVCTSPGCVDCHAPEACMLCAPTFMGGDCKQCSDQAAVNSAYPNCEAARQTDTLATWSAMAMVLLLAIMVMVITLCAPLSVFYSGSQSIQTPNANIPIQVDFVLPTRQLTLVVDSPISLDSAHLEGVDFASKSVRLSGGEAWSKSSLGSSLNLTPKQMTNFLAGRYHVDVVADAGAGPVMTSYVLRVPIRRNLPNAIAVFTIILDFIQLSAFCFGKDIVWWSRDPIPRTLHYTLLVLPPAFNFWYSMFWILFGAAALFVVLVCLIKSGLDRKLSCCRATDNILSRVYGTVMPFIGQTLYLPIVTVMLSVMSCSRPVTVENAMYTANFDQDHVTCWVGEHWLYVCLAIITIVVYYPLAVATLPLWQTVNPKLDVRYFPTFLVVSSQVKFILAVTGQLFSTIPYVQSVLLIVLSLPVVLMAIWRPPTIVYPLRWPIMASYMCVAWAGVSSIVALYYPNAFISSLVLYAGWAVLLVISLIAAMRPNNTTTGDENPAALSAVRRVMNNNVSQVALPGGANRLTVSRGVAYQPAGSHSDDGPGGDTALVIGGDEIEVAEPPLADDILAEIAAMEDPDDGFGVHPGVGVPLGVIPSPTASMVAAFNFAEPTRKPAAIPSPSLTLRPVKE